MLLKRRDAMKNPFKIINAIIKMEIMKKAKASSNKLLFPKEHFGICKCLLKGELHLLRNTY